jgi:NTE family protein
VAERLKPLALPPAEFAALRAKQSVTPPPDSRAVDEIRFVELQRVNPQAAQAVMETKTGEPIDQQVLDADMRRLYGTGDFERVGYRFLEEPGRRVLAVDAVEKSWGPDYLRMGLGLSSDFSGDSFFNALASYRRTWLNSLGAEWRTDAQVGRTSSLSTEFYQPLNARGTYFVDPDASVGRRSEVFYQGNNRIAVYDINTAAAGFDVGTQFAQYGEFRIGVLRGQVRPELDIGALALAPLVSSIAQGGFTARLTLDQMDSVRFPRSGWSAAFNVFDSTGELGADHSYVKWDTTGIAAHSFGENTLNFAFKVGGKLGSDPLPYYDMFQWGGFLQQSGYATGQLLGQNMWYLRAMYYRRILQGTLFEGAYGGFSLEAGKVDEPLIPGNPDGDLWSASLFVAVDTPIGPVYLAYGRAAAGLGSFYFFLGRPF